MDSYAGAVGQIDFFKKMLVKSNNQLKQNNVSWLNPHEMLGK
jgi:hypothetical protein